MFRETFKFLQDAAYSLRRGTMQGCQSNIASRRYQIKIQICKPSSAEVVPQGKAVAGLWEITCPGKALS